MIRLTFICVKIFLFCELANGWPIVADIYNLLEGGPSANTGNRTDSKLPSWQYEDSYNWNQVYLNCDGKFQSPINIDPANVLIESYPKLVFGNYNNIMWSMRITNDGHTVLLDLPLNYPADKMPYIKGGGLSDKFIFMQLHFHWGGDSGRGSEHLIQHRQYSGELHIVHYNSKYSSFSEASKHQDGIAVLGIFMENTGYSDNTVLSLIVEQFGEIKKSGQGARLRTPIILQDLLPNNLQNFYRYTGSLTTPGCQEVVSWTIFETPLIVSEYQLEKFRQLFDKKGRKIEDNFRPIQDERGRIIFYNSENGQQPLQQEQYRLENSSEFYSPFTFV